jgi:hypothetical protein
MGDGGAWAMTQLAETRTECARLRAALAAAERERDALIAGDVWDAEAAYEDPPAKWAASWQHPAGHWELAFGATPIAALLAADAALAALTAARAAGGT